jgi:DNA-binding MarR family transcriptional regulator
MIEATPDECDGARLSAFLERAVPLLRSISGDQPISPSAASLLALLDTAGRARITELARVQGISQPGMTQLVRRLAAEGLVTRTGDHQTRATWVEITPAGRLALEQRRSRREHGLTAMLSHLEMRDRSAVAQALPSLERLLVLWEGFAEDPGGQVGRDCGTPVRREQAS